MAVTANLLDSSFTARFQTGISVSGAPIIRQKTFSGVKASATAQDIYDVADALFGLLTYPLVEVQRNDRFGLVNQE